MNNWTSTKFASQILVLFLSAGLLYLGKLDGTTWALLVGGIVGTYATANVAEKRGRRDQ